MNSLSNPPQYRDPRTGHLLEGYRDRTHDLGFAGLRVYWWVDPLFATEQAGGGPRWGWRWRLGKHVADDLYATRTEAQWAGIEGSLVMLDEARAELRKLIKKKP